MGRQVPAVERAIEILELLGERPNEQLGLSEIARALDMNKASCHATLALLSDRGYLQRHGDKTYSLGPAILTLANSFLHDQEALPYARAEMESLSRDLGLDCVASAVADDAIVVLAQSQAASSFGVSVRVGTQFPLVPPIGTVFLAWARPELVGRWLANMDEAAGAAQHQRTLDALAIVRERGYSVALATAPTSDGDGGRIEVDDYLLFELDERQRLPIGHIAAPVFDPEGSVRLALTVAGFHDRVTSENIPMLAERLLAATQQVAFRTWGRSTADGEPSGGRRAHRVPT